MAQGKDDRYYSEQDKLNILKTREVLETLPKFCRQYIRGIEENTSTRTRLAYIYDIRTFFEFLHERNLVLSKIDITDYKLDLLDHINREDIEEYLEYVTLYDKDGKELSNEEFGKARKIASIRSLYNYFYKAELIETNPPALVRTPKLLEHEIIRLEPDEFANMLDSVEGGDGLTKSQKRFHEKTKVRDVALITLLLGTGIRVSELVGLDLNDVDFRNNGIRVHRKGGYDAVVYFGDEVEIALKAYLEERDQILPQQGSENAVFLSLQNKRISVRAVENLVKKYAQTVTTLKRITPHKLRSTYGTTLYKESGDIYLVADVLGHKDVNTTRKHYAAQTDENRRRAARIVKLRDPK